MTMLHIAEWLESTAVATLVRESTWGFPIVVAVHLMGLSLSVGMILWFDLRLVGVALRGSPVSVVYRRLMPWAGTGFAVMFLSGAMLLAGYATAALGNVYFQGKLAAMALAGLNAVFFHLFTQRRLGEWDAAGTPPVPARLAGAISMAAWAVVILAGRMMSYTMF
jgi:hypothetical protein